MDENNMTIIEALQCLNTGEKIRHSSHKDDSYLVLNEKNMLVNQDGKLAGIHLHGYSYLTIMSKNWVIVNK